MQVGTDSFRGELPRLTPRALPDNASQDATNARLVTGDATAWQQLLLAKSLAMTAPVGTIAKIGPDGDWMSFEGDVDVARGIIPGDTTYRTYLTGPEFDRPQWTNLDMATTGSEPFPVLTRPLGVPAPDTAPTVTAGIDPNSTTFNVDVIDEGGQFDSWTVQSPSTDTFTGGYTSLCVAEPSFGRPSPSYSLRGANNNFQNGVQAFMHKDFGTTNCTVVRTVIDFLMSSDVTPGYIGSFGVFVQATADGGGIFIGGHNQDSGQMFMQLATQYSSYGMTLLKLVGGIPWTIDQWYTMEVTNVTNADGTQTITVSVYLGSVQITGMQITGTFTTGTHVGFLSQQTQDGKTYYDNILVQGSGSTGYVPVNTATSYVYRFTNDVNESSAPSFASATVLRPDGVSTTVTTPTDLPSGISSEWGITKKQIFRSVTGDTGTIFRFVAEIPLEQADYVDTLATTELGDALDSQGWDLPPADMRGILALPNGVMVGFSKNQLCFSAQNRPHAWPVNYRLNTDTDIVGIGAIDTTVVIGTQSFPYIASGVDPAAFGMAKLEVQQACVAKRSVVPLLGIGVVFASPDGLVSVLGPGQVRNLTEDIFTREQWQALAPETIIAASHDNVYHFFYDTDVVPVEQPIFLDTFTGSNGTNIVEAPHLPDIQLDGSVWEPSGEGSDPMLDGTGHVTKDPATFSQASARTWFNAVEIDGYPLQLGWRVETTVEPLTYSAGGQTDSVILLTGNDNADVVEITVFNGVRVAVEVDYELVAEETYASPGVDEFEIVVQVADANTIHVFINNELQTPIAVTAVPLEIENLFMEIGTLFDSDEPLPTARFSRIAIYDGDGA